MDSTNSNTLRTQLQAIANEPRSLRSSVARFILDSTTHENLREYFSDLLNHACHTGIVTGLTNLQETHEFYHAHKEEIEALRMFYKEYMDMHYQFDGDYKQDMAWIAFGHFVSVLYRELGRKA